MNKKKCFISFDYDNDKNLKDLLIGQSENEDSPFKISDWSVKEESDDWKEKAKNRIKRSDVVIVLCGEKTNKATGVSVELKIAQDEEVNYFLLGGYSNGKNKKPTAAKNGDKMYKWTWENLRLLIHGNR